MSNTADISPSYQTETGAETGAAVAAAVSETLAAMAQAMAPTDAEREIVARARTLARRERLAGTRVKLALGANGDLLGTAARLGFSGADAQAGARLAAGRPVELARGRETLLLQRVGESLAILAPGGSAAIDTLVSGTVMMRAERHLARVSAGPVTRRVLANGEVELVAGGPALGGGRPRIAARVRRDGAILADISCVAGARCERIAADLAEATSGTVTGQAFKEEYYADPVAPGEPVQIRPGG